MNHTLTSDALTVVISDIGAELQSMVSNKTGEEFIWQGDPAIWGSRSPVLFPIIGGLKNGVYQYGGQEFALGKHGFVRGKAFTPVQSASAGDACAASADTLTLAYTDNTETRKQYPFAFLFETVFTLRGDTLAVTYRVENRTGGAFDSNAGGESDHSLGTDMYFSTGAHEGYRCPRRTDECFEDYYLAFDRDGHYESIPVSGKGLLVDEPFTVIDNGRILPLKHALFEHDALIFRDIAAKKVAIKSRKSPTVVEVCYDAPHLGVWTKVGAPFICLEPWCGLPDFEDANGQLTEKPGIIRLSAGSRYEFNHSIKVVEA